MSHLTHRPRLIYTDADWPTINNRLSREPYITLYNRVKSRANGTPATRPQHYDPPREYGAANIAKSAAFVYAVEGDSAKAEHAALILEDMETDFTWPDLAGLIWLLDYDIHTAEAIQGYCAAFDILAGAGYLTAQREQDIRARLETMLINCWNFYLVDWYWYRQEFSTTNHFTKIATAFGTAAITLNQSSYASDWINNAMTWGVERIFVDSSTNEGAFVEGPSYHVYAEVQHVPFFIQYNRFTGGGSATFQRRDCNFFGRNCTYTPENVDDPLNDPQLLNMAMWMLNIRLPDGTCPPVDDSTKIGNINGLIGGALNDPYLVWDWLNATAAPYYSKYCSDLTIDAIIDFDDSITPQEPTWGPSIIYPEDGFAVFRTGWGDDADYAILLAESGKVRINGKLHEHADTLSFLYWSEGKMLAIDPGYIKWQEHDKVRFGVDHNVVDIDGQGPPAPIIIGTRGVDGLIHQYDMESSTQFAVASTRYSGTDWVRGFFFYGDLVIVGDTLSSDRQRDFEFLLHGNGGGDTGGSFALTNEGARWSIDGVSLDLVIEGTLPITQTHWEDFHGWDWSQAHTHEVFSGAVTGQNVGYAAALVPQIDTSNINVNTVAIQPGCAALEASGPGYDDVLMVEDGTGQCTYNSTPPVGVESGGAWIRPTEYEAVVFGKDATFFADGRSIWQTNGTSMWIEWGDGWFEVEPDFGDDNFIVVQTDGPWTTVTGTCVQYTMATPFLTWVKIDGVCKVRIEYASFLSKNTTSFF